MGGGSEPRQSRKIKLNQAIFEYAGNKLFRFSQQNLTPLQVAIEKGRPAVVRLLRHPPLIVYERPFGLLNLTPQHLQQQQQQQVMQQPQQQPQQQQQQYPFRTFQGLQRYSDEISR